MQTIDELIRDRAGDHAVGLAFADRTWTHDQVVAEQAQRAAVLASLRRPGPFHVALMLDNVPEFVFWMGGAALAGAVMVGANPTHRGDELARDLSHTECQLLVTNAGYRALVEGYDLGPALPPERILIIDDPSGDLAEPATPYGSPGVGPGRCAPPRPGSDRGHRRDARVPAVHLGHLRGTQGLPVQPGAHGPDRRGRGPDVPADQ